MNILFVCSRNQWRSKTAETIFKDTPGHHVRSAGTENAARIKVSGKLLQWAELIFVMEKKHKDRLIEKFPGTWQDKEIVILDIKDDYQYMDDELIDILRKSVEPYF